MTINWPPNGTAFLLLPVPLCQIPAWLHGDVVPTHPAGSTADILQWPRAWWFDEFVITGAIIAVGGGITSRFATVEDSTCTNFRGLRTVICDTVEKPR